MDIKMSGIGDRLHQLIPIAPANEHETHEPKFLTPEDSERIGLFGIPSFAGVLVFVGGHPGAASVVDSSNQTLEVWPSIDLERPYPPTCSR